MLLLWVALGFLLSQAEVGSPLGPAFAGSEQCRSCHQDRHETWMTTAHAYSLREPSPSSVMGRFDGQAIETPHFIAVPYRRDGGFWIRVQRKDGRPSGDHYVSHVVGRSFEQAYLFTGPRGEWRVLPICWSLARHKDLRCVDCHMPRLITGILHLMRDHSLVSPEPELTERYGEANAPNACGVCHREKSAAWARQWKGRWWRPAPKTLVENVGMVVDLRRGLKVDGAKLAALAESREARLFFRLTAIRHLAERRTARSRASVRRLLFDPDDQVRQLACEAIAADPHPEAAVPLLKLLQDPVRTVRVEAAFALARCGWRGKDAAFDRAYADAEKMLERQRSFDEILERLIMLADASERRTEMVAHLALLSGRTTHLKTSGELLGRYARVLLEQGDSQNALAFAKQPLGRAGDSVGPYLREYLYLDPRRRARSRRPQRGSGEVLARPDEQFSSRPPPADCCSAPGGSPRGSRHGTGAARRSNPSLPKRSVCG